MLRIPSLIFFFAMAIGCGTTPVKESKTAADADIICHPINTDTPPKISVIEGDGVRVHTFLTPEVSSSTATHIIETHASLVVVDTQLLRDYAQQFHDYAVGLHKPITHVIVSHGHPDHYFGLEYFEAYPTYAFSETQIDMKERHKFHLRMHREVEGECDEVTDRVRFVQNDLPEGTLEVDGIALLIERATNAEDNDQAVILVPAAKTMILQDLMATDTHAFIAAGMIPHWITVLKDYQSREGYTHVLAGHGSPTDMNGIATMIDYLERGQQILDTSSTAEAFQESMRAEFPDKSGYYLVDLMAKIKFK